MGVLRTTVWPGRECTAASNLPGGTVVGPRVVGGRSSADPLGAALVADRIVPSGGMPPYRAWLADGSVLAGPGPWPVDCRSGAFAKVMDRLGAVVVVPLPTSLSPQISISVQGDGGIAPGVRLVLSRLSPAQLPRTVTLMVAGTSVAVPAGEFVRTDPDGEVWRTPPLAEPAILPPVGVSLVLATIADHCGRSNEEQATVTRLGPPVITSSLSVGAVYNQAFSYQITATNNPTYFAAAGLPPGLSLNPVTGVISGTMTYEQNNGFAVVGSAVVTDDVVQVTDSVQSQHGAAWLVRTARVDQPFRLSCEYRASGGGGNPADGIAAVIQRDGLAAFGAPGRGIGYLGLHGVACEIDDFANLGDPNNKHVAIQGMYNGALEAQHGMGTLSGPATLPFSINDGVWRSLTVTYDGTTLSMAIAGVTYCTVDVQLASHIGADVCWFGFTGSTGFFYARHEIRKLSLFNSQTAQYLVEISASNANGSDTKMLAIGVST